MQSALFPEEELPVPVAPAGKPPKPVKPAKALRYLEASAVIDGDYRYSLCRRWTEGKERVIFCMLNPSTADGTQDDPTVKRCVAFAKQWGCNELEIVNLFAYRATDTAVMWAAESPIGPKNDAAIRDALARGGRVIAAWGVGGNGADKEKLTQRQDAVLEILCEKRSVECLETTKAGFPGHPLYIDGNTSPKLFRLHAHNKRIWHREDLVLHACDAKKPEMLLTITGVELPVDGGFRFQCKYICDRYPNSSGRKSKSAMGETRTFSIEELLDPRKFGVTVRPGPFPGDSDIPFTNKDDAVYIVP